MEILYVMLSGLLTQLPILLVWLGGAILALAYWKRCPPAAMLTMIALALFFVIMLIDNYLNGALPILMRERAWSNTQMGTLYTVKAVLSALARAIAWGLLLPAIFGWRGDKKTVPPVQNLPVAGQ